MEFAVPCWELGATCGRPQRQNESCANLSWELVFSFGSGPWVVHDYLWVWPRRPAKPGSTPTGVPHPAAELPSLPS